MSRYYYKHIDTENIKSNIAWVVRHKLFVKDWMLIRNMLDCLTSNIAEQYKGRPKYLMGLMLLDERYKHIPVGVCFIVEDNMDIYIAEQHRRKGLGKRLFEELNAKYGIHNSVKVRKGVKGSIAFYESIGLTIGDTTCQVNHKSSTTSSLP